MIVAESVIERVKSEGVGSIFLLSGGHIFPLIDAAYKQGLRLIDVRHEQSAAFAADAVAKLTARPAVALVTAGPGVTNAVSAMASALKAESPLVVLAGRAPQNRWGSGSLQEFEHLEVVKGATKWCATLTDPTLVQKIVAKAFSMAANPPRGPVFVDFPLDVLISRVEDAPEPESEDNVLPPSDEVQTVVEKIRKASRPLLFLGSQVWMGGAHGEALKAAETIKIPVLTNSMARGIIPPSSPLNATPLRSQVLSEADLVLVVGAPLDFRLNFGKLGSGEVVQVTDSDATLSPAATLGFSCDLKALFTALEMAFSKEPIKEASQFWHRSIGEPEPAGSAEPTEPLKMAYTISEISKVIPSDSIVIGDGGDFVSYLGRIYQPPRPGAWLDTGPFGCLGCGLGYAIGAKAAFPDRDVVVFLGDGAFGFCATDIDTLARHGLGAVLIVGNNGIWGLEKHPMRTFYGYDVAADLQPKCPYHLLAESLGGKGFLVEKPDELVPAFDTALKIARDGVPALLNVIIDPEDVYPRRSNLA